MVNEKGETVPFSTAISSSDVYRLNLAGTQYRLFVQPLRLSLFERSKGGIKTESDESWSLCGLVQTDRFRSESLTISYTLLFLFLFALVMGSWPLLKLWSLVPADRLRLADVILASMSISLISVLVTFFLLDFYVDQRLETRLDDQLKQFAGDFAGRFDNELGQLCGLLGRAESAVRLSSLDDKIKKSVLCVPKGGDPMRSGSPDWLGDNAPYFDMITWVGTQGTDDGKQIRKWTTQQANTPLIDVSDRDYFREIKEGRAWTKSFDDRTFKFFLEPIVSLNTGETLAELAMPGHYLDRWLNDTTVNIYSSFFFKTSFEQDASSQVSTNHASPEKHLFEEAMEKIRPLYNDIAVQTHELVYDETADGSYQWASDQRGRIRLAQWPVPSPTFQRISSEVPVLQWPSEPGWCLGLAAVILLFFVGVYVLVRFVATKIFLLHLALSPLRGGTEVTDLGKVTENILLLGGPHSGKSKLLSRPDFRIVDIRRLRRLGHGKKL